MILGAMHEAIHYKLCTLTSELLWFWSVIWIKPYTVFARELQQLSPCQKTRQFIEYVGLWR